MQIDFENEESVVRRYYELIDQNRMTDVCKLFADGVQYLRGDKQIDGIDEIEDFYLNKRIVKSGIHKYTLDVTPPVVRVTGIFSGLLNNGERVSLPFLDVFTIIHGEITERRTIFPEMTI